MNNYLRILSVDNPADAVKLARKAKRVINPQSTEVIVGIQRMKRAATAWEHQMNRRCEGLAATQIGWNRRVIILRANDEMEPKDPRTFTEAEYRTVLEAEIAANPALQNVDERLIMLSLVQKYDEWNRRFGGVFDPWMVLINPTIKQVEGERESTEGCLSVPNGGYVVMRPTHVAFKFTMPNKTYSGVHLAKGDNAIKLMHEIDHLRGKTINQHGTVIIGGGDEKL